MVVRLMGVALACAACWACGEPPTIVVEPLQVISWVPNRGAQCVAATRDTFRAAVTFSDDIDSTSLSADTIFVLPQGGTAVPDEIQYDKATHTARLLVADDLAHGTIHELVVTEGVRGASRGYLLDELRSPFTTVTSGGCFQP